MHPQQTTSPNHNETIIITNGGDSVEGWLPGGVVMAFHFLVLLSFA